MQGNKQTNLNNNYIGPPPNLMSNRGGNNFLGGSKARIENEYEDNNQF